MLFSKNLMQTELTTSQEQLFYKLESFGLSPDDWHIEKVDSKFLLTHLENSDFQFVGYSTPDFKDWQSIHLFSL